MSGARRTTRDARRPFAPSDVQGSGIVDEFLKENPGVFPLSDPSGTALVNNIKRLGGAPNVKTEQIILVSDGEAFPFEVFDYDGLNLKSDTDIGAFVASTVWNLLIIAYEFSGDPSKMELCKKFLRAEVGRALDVLAKSELFEKLDPKERARSRDDIRKWLDDAIISDEYVNQMKEIVARQGLEWQDPVLNFAFGLALAAVVGIMLHMNAQATAPLVLASMGGHSLFTKFGIYILGESLHAAPYLLGMVGGFSIADGAIQIGQGFAKGRRMIEVGTKTRSIFEIAQGIRMRSEEYANGINLGFGTAGAIAGGATFMPARIAKIGKMIRRPRTDIEIARARRERLRRNSTPSSPSPSPLGGEGSDGAQVFYFTDGSTVRVVVQQPGIQASAIASVAPVSEPVPMSLPESYAIALGISVPAAKLADTGFLTAEDRYLSEVEKHNRAVQNTTPSAGLPALALRASAGDGAGPNGKVGEKHDEPIPDEILEAEKRVREIDEEIMQMRRRIYERLHGRPLTTDLYNEMVLPLLDRIEQAMAEVTSIRTSTDELITSRGWSDRVRAHASHFWHDAINQWTSISYGASLWKDKLLLAGGRLEDFDPSVLRTEMGVLSVVSYIIRLNSQKAKSLGVDIVLHVSDEVSAFSLGKGQQKIINDVFNNAISNAVKYHDPDKPAGERRVEISVRKEGDSLVIEVVDNGRGMSAEELTNYGHHEWRAEDVRAEGIEGHGIGSGSAIQKTKELGGTFEISSPGKGKGTTVRITIPIERLSATPPQTKPAPMSPDLTTLLPGEAAAFVAKLSPEEKLGVAVELFNKADEMHSRAVKAIRDAETTGTADQNTYRRLLEDWEREAMWLRAVDGALRQVPWNNELGDLMRALLSSVGQVFAVGYTLTIIADMFKVGRPELTRELVKSVLKVADREMRNWEGNGYRVGRSRRELAFYFIVFLGGFGNRAKVSWVDHRLVIEAPTPPVEDPPYRYTPWPPDPNNLVVRTVLQILGWKMEVVTSGDRTIIRLDFGATRV